MGHRGQKKDAGLRVKKKKLNCGENKAVGVAEREDSLKRLHFPAPNGANGFEEEKIRSPSFYWMCGGWGVKLPNRALGGKELADEERGVWRGRVRAIKKDTKSGKKSG